MSFAIFILAGIVTGLIQTDRNSASTATGAAAQDLRLEISVPKTSLTIREPVNLTVKLINTSTKPYYVSSDMALGVGQEFGTYRLQVRRDGTFVDGPYTAEDLLPRPNLSVADFILRHQLAALGEGMFIGRTMKSTWDDLARLKPGRYSIRVTYTTYGNEREIPQGLRFPIFRSPLTSNVIDIEIQP